MKINKLRLFWIIFLGMMVLSISIEPNSRLGFAASSAIEPQAASAPIFSCFGNNTPSPPADTTPPETTTPWAKSYGGTSNDNASSFQQTSDGGYIIASNTNSFGAGGVDLWVLKSNSDGTVAWQKAYGGTSDDYANSIQQTSDGGYILAGFPKSFGAGNGDFWVLKLNSDESVAWQKSYGEVGAEEPRSIQQTSDGGYIVAGQTSSFGAGDFDLWVLKLNSDGTVAWQKTYGGTSHDYAFSIQQTSDGDYIVAGATVSFSAGLTDFWILKLNSDGTVAWQKTYGGTGDDWAYSIQLTLDGGYIVVGYTSSFGAGGYDFWILKLNSDGTVAWQKTYGGTDDDFSVSTHQTSDGGYIVAGQTSSFGAGGNDLWVLKLNSYGTVAWQKTYGGTSDDFGLIRQTSDGNYIVVGSSNSFGAGGYDLWVLKLSSDGSIIFNPSSGASVTNTSATVTDTSATITNTSATITNTSATITNTNATITDTNAIINQQAP
ncbi:MAG: hypothetical protein NT056_06175 [Proteobacteria bacterium]|nr:hypothetical protein [Pseudomonadota bacterium]